jgi:hypothetical protein
VYNRDTGRGNSREGGGRLRERRGPVDPHGTALRKARHERRLRLRLALNLLLPPARCAQRPRKLRSNLVAAMARPVPPQAPARRNRNGAAPRAPGRAGAPRASASSLRTAPGCRCRPLRETGGARLSWTPAGDGRGPPQLDPCRRQARLSWGSLLSEPAAPSLARPWPRGLYPPDRSTASGRARPPSP